MNKLLSLGLGLAVGAAVGAAAVVLFSPQSGLALRQNLRESFQEALAEARRAGEIRRAELEAQLAVTPNLPGKSG
ncbi:MAG TPA: YtxH domain-containing protein [Candidatus Limnocylindrales bacterium]|nr:YtxH domain-containing protein [Candidatus Limnocylindrales bacterium]